MFLPGKDTFLSNCNEDKRRKEGSASRGWNEATHQVLFTEPSELLKLLCHEELSTAHCTADRAQHYERGDDDKSSTSYNKCVINATERNEKKLLGDSE